MPKDASLAVAGISPVVTPNNKFYRIDTVLCVPQVDPDHWTLKVHGRVDHPYELTFAEVLKMPMVEEYVTLQCVSNDVGGPLVGTAKWLGVPLPMLLDRAGVHPGADQIVGRSVDYFTVGFPTKAALDGRTALLAVGMNGEPLPTRTGSRRGSIIAGLYGYVSATKWVTELEATTFADYDAYWVPRGWSQQAPIKTESRIDTPRGTRARSPAGRCRSREWRGRRPRHRAGRGAGRRGDWHDGRARRRDQQGDLAAVGVPLAGATSGQHEIRVRATDGAGKTQSGVEPDPAPNGATGYHTIVVNVA